MKTNPRLLLAAVLAAHAIPADACIHMRGPASLTLATAFQAGDLREEKLSATAAGSSSGPSSDGGFLLKFYVGPTRVKPYPKSLSLADIQRHQAVADDELARRNPYSGSKGLGARGVVLSGPREPECVDYKDFETATVPGRPGRSTTKVTVEICEVTGMSWDELAAHGRFRPYLQGNPMARHYAKWVEQVGMNNRGLYSVTVKGEHGIEGLAVMIPYGGAGGAKAMAEDRWYEFTGNYGYETSLTLSNQDSAQIASAVASAITSDRTMKCSKGEVRRAGANLGVYLVDRRGAGPERLLMEVVGNRIVGKNSAIDLSMLPQVCPEAAIEPQRQDPIVHRPRTARPPDRECADQPLCAADADGLRHGRRWVSAGMGGRCLCSQ